LVPFWLFGANLSVDGYRGFPFGDMGESCRPATVSCLCLEFELIVPMDLGGDLFGNA